MMNSFFLVSCGENRHRFVCNFTESNKMRIEKKIENKKNQFKFA